MQKTARSIHLFQLILIVIIWTLGVHCSSQKKIITHYGYDMRQLAEADSLFNEGLYELAKMKYTKIKNDMKNKKIAEIAQYSLGYINIYHENPFADFQAALREFKLYMSTYPNGQNLENAKNWVRMLTSFKNFDKDFKGNQSMLNTIKTQKNTIQKSYDDIFNAYTKCYSKKDSLEKRIAVLEEVLLILENPNIKNTTPKDTIK